MKSCALVTGKTVPLARAFTLFLFAFLLCLASFLHPFVGAARADLQGTDGLVRLSSPEIMKQGGWSVGLFGNYYRRMSPTAHSVTENFAVGNLSARYGLTKAFEAFIVLPGNGALWQYKKLPDREEQSVNHGGLGDARFGLKMKVPFESERYALGFELGTSVPTGKNTELWLPDQTTEKLFTSGSTNFFGRVCGSIDLSRVQVLSPLKLVANVGYLLNREKEKVRFPSYLFSIPGLLDNKDMLSGGFALVFPSSRVTLFTELYTEQLVQGSDVAGRKENPIFLTPGAKIKLPFDLVATAAFDLRLSADDPKTAFNPDETFPEWGFTLGLDFTPAFFGNDMDGDGIPDTEDLCPAEREDFDGFRDEDGCPDPDNDNDGVPDLTDKCPDQVEDLDGFRDTDGCRDADNDADGVPDSADKCPNQPGSKANAGCPDSISVTQPALPPVQPTEMRPTPPVEVDSDNDGLPDSRDKCPTLAEDNDGFQDEDGCPDIDNDADGVVDADDKCPNKPGPESKGGCP
jgi:hypothetical protein